MKRIIFLLMVLSALSVQAQQKRFDNDIYLGAGVMIEDHGYSSETGVSFKAGYGLAYHFSTHSSVKAGIAIRNTSENFFGDSLDGADDDTFTFMDIPILVQYHTGRGLGSCTFSLGPVFSFCTGNDTYYIDADPTSPLNKLNKCKKFSVGLQPGFSYQFSKHFSLGIDGHIGLTNIKDNHQLTTGSKHIHCITAKVAYIF